jgi:hypothetical protein
MRKALWLIGLFLCVSGAQAAQKGVAASSEGKKRNEEVYEKWLEQTGWKETSENVRNPHLSRRDTKTNPPHNTPSPES